MGSTNTYRRSKRASKRVEVPNLAQAAKSELLVAVKGRKGPPFLYAQRLFMSPKYNDATSLEELGSTKTYRRSKRALKRVQVPANLAQAVKLHPAI